jgi:hypothetical protein
MSAVAESAHVRIVLADYLEWLLWRTQRIESHECREWFKVDGEPLHDPHAPHAND